MVDMILVLIRFLAIVLAPDDANEIVIVPQQDAPAFLVKEDGAWVDYVHRSPEKCTLEKDQRGGSGYVAEYWLTPKQPIKLSKDFAIPAGVFERTAGTFRITGKSGTVVLERMDGGFNCSFGDAERQPVFVRWRRAKKE